MMIQFGLAWEQNMREKGLIWNLTECIQLQYKIIIFVYMAQYCRSDECVQTCSVYGYKLSMYIGTI